MYFTKANNRCEAELIESYLIAKYHPCLNRNKKYPEFGISISTKPWRRYKRENELAPQEFDFNASRILGSCWDQKICNEDIYSDVYRQYIRNLEKN